VELRTRIFLGIDAAGQELTSGHHIAGHQPVIVLLSDGLANPEPPSSAVAADWAKALGITVFAIGSG
jgi:hypothetical protein